MVVKKKIIIYLIFIIILAIFFNIFPNYHALKNTPSNYVFSGQASWFDPWDINVYVSTIKWGQQKNILLENLYTTQDNIGIIMYPLYTLSGYLLNSLNPFIVFYIFSIIFSIFIIIVCYIFTRLFLTADYSLLAVFLIIFGGGLGWMFFPNFSSADLYMTGFTFVSQLQRPHEALGVSLYFIALCSFYLSVIKNMIRYNLISCISLIILVFIYPYNLISYFVICGIFSLLYLFKKSIKKTFIYLSINLIIILPIAYLYYSHLQSNITFSSVISQKLDTPNLIEIISGYGLLTFFLIFQFKSKENYENKLFLNVWFFSSIFLSFMPLGFSRFFLRGLFFPLIILSIYGLTYLTKKNKIPKILLLVFMLVFIPLSSEFIFIKRIAEVKNNNSWYYISNSQNLAIRFFNNNLLLNQNVLASYHIGNLLPAVTKQRVYFGHFIQTPKSEEKIINLTKFFGNTYSDEEALNFLKQNNIKYIWFGKEESDITYKYSKSNNLKYKFLSTIFEAGDVLILKHNP